MCSYWTHNTPLTDHHTYTHTHNWQMQSLTHVELHICAISNIHKHRPALAKEFKPFKRSLRFAFSPLWVSLNTRKFSCTCANSAHVYTCAYIHGLLTATHNHTIYFLFLSKLIFLYGCFLWYFSCTDCRQLLLVDYVVALIIKCCLIFG